MCESVTHVNVKDEDEKILSEKNEVCERWKKYSKVCVREESSADIIFRQRMIVAILKKADQNIKREEVKKKT